jgi:DNA-binding NarL/FixJ family response regulator
VRVVLAEDSGLLRDALTRLLGDHEIEVAAAVTTVPELLEAYEREQPDVAVIDVRLPPTFTDEGIRGAVELRRARPGAPVLVLSQYVEERYARDLLNDRAEGIGYLLKDRVADVREFVHALRRVAAGGAVFDPEVVRQLLVRHRSIDELTAREREVMQLVAEGHSNASIARELVVTERAVEKHVGRILQKLHIPPNDDHHRRVLAVLAWLKAD